MIEVERILDIEQYLYGIDTVLFDLDEGLCEKWLLRYSQTFPGNRKYGEEALDCI